MGRSRGGSLRGTSVGRFVAGAMIALSLVALNLPEWRQQALGHALRQSVLLPFIELHEALTERRTRARDFAVLRAQMDSAMAMLAWARTLAGENQNLRSLLDALGGTGSEPDPANMLDGIDVSSEFRYIGGAVTRSGTAGSASYFRMGVGEQQGVQTYSAVVTDSGLLGQVQEARPGYSIGIDWSHPDFRAAAMTVDGADHGLVMPERGNYREQDRLLIHGLAFLSELETGAEIVTSGRGGTYPRGILIGWVAGEASTSAGWSRSYYVTPAVHPGEAYYAAIVLVEDGGESIPEPAPAP